jgi:hypothetical protein
MKTIIALLSAVLMGCAAAPINPGADRVRVANIEPGKDCKFIGSAVGSQGTFISGPWTSNQNLETGAVNDLKNKAAAMGGNVAVIQTQRAGRYGIHETSSTITGSVYRCPE